MNKNVTDGHRGRARDAYLTTSVENMPDHHIIELLLFYAIPRKDVKPIAFELVQKFGTLEKVLNASIEELTSINGIGENAAIMLKLVGDVSKKLNNNSNNRINNSTEAKEYVKSVLHNLQTERLLLITLDDEHTIINCNNLADGDDYSAKIEPKQVAECVVKDNAKNVILAHNHPAASATPSAEDINFTIEVLNMLRTMHINLNDHIIVGKSNTICMSEMLQYTNFFDK